ncbi:alpha/beta hydrolase domain-containing protein [Rhodobacteraceae bacterium KMM 6894]|nr:alpha/beta hydrolase domain-containing protein [Rhodobacteraceae bacterium KMM 6894]
MPATIIDYRVTDRRPFADGQSFGQVGAYERLTGRATFRIDPDAPEVAGVTDIALGQRDADGLLTCESDFCILRPVDPARGNGALFYDYGNRGDKRALQFFNAAVGSNAPLDAAHAGDGFLMRRGYTVVWLGWQGDLYPGDGRVVLDVPIATEGGQPVTGQITVELMASQAGVTSMPLSAFATTRSYPAVSQETTRARLTRRPYTHAPRECVAASDWSFARLAQGGGIVGNVQSAVIPSPTDIYLPGGFEPGWIYELTYQARDPRLLGLGHVVVRDFISYLRNGAAPVAGQPALTEAQIDRAYAWGRSQTGRCIRDFVYLGFNADADGRRVFDGVMPHVAGAGRMWMNHRFANINLLPGQEHENHFAPADRFPFSYALSTDHVSGAQDAILKRPETDPLVIHTDTASEYWHRRASLVHTETTGADLDLPEGVRVYFWASSQHFSDPQLGAPTQGITQTPCNVVATHYFFRAALDALDAWSRDGTPPPDSRYPRRSDDTLVSYKTWRDAFPDIPGLALPRGPSALEHLDFGAAFAETGAIADPPQIVPGAEYAVQVPMVDSDGNDLGGLRAPMVDAPLGTYTGWAVRRRGVGHGAMLGITGSYIPFSDSEAEREQTGDPRPSIQSRHQTSDAYVDAIRTAATALVADRFMLDEDIQRCADLARDWGRPRHLTRLPVTPSTPDHEDLS